MPIVSTAIVSLVSLEHWYILWFEMFAWESRGPKIFRKFDKALFPKTKDMAANQGLYNGFLAAGLVWSLMISDEVWSKRVASYFLGCVFCAGAYGAATVTKKIFYMQGIPSMLGLLAIQFGI